MLLSPPTEQVVPPSSDSLTFEPRRPSVHIHSRPRGNERRPVRTSTVCCWLVPCLGVHSRWRMDSSRSRIRGFWSHDPSNGSTRLDFRSGRGGTRDSANGAALLLVLGNRVWCCLTR